LKNYLAKEKHSRTLIKSDKTKKVGCNKRGALRRQKG